MTQELSKNLMVVCIRNGINVWLEDDQIVGLKVALKQSKESKFIEIGSRYLNTADIVGIFTPQDMEEQNKRKQGLWKCNHNEWHLPRERCECWRR